VVPVVVNFDAILREVCLDLNVVDYSSISPGS
jgi:hypothetical protein